MEAYEELAEQVQQRNQERRRAAVQALRERGFEETTDTTGTVSLDGSGRERCVAALHARAEIDDGETLSVTVTPAGADRFELVVPASAACAFFGHRARTLLGTRDGDTVELLRSSRPLARDRDGAIYYLDIEVEVVSTRTVVVERTCNRMPMVEPHPLERDLAERVLLAPEPTEHVTMHLEREELEVECTEYVY